jgi:hypothetical protein
LDGRSERVDSDDTTREDPSNLDPVAPSVNARAGHDAAMMATGVQRLRVLTS